MLNNFHTFYNSLLLVKNMVVIMVLIVASDIWFGETRFDSLKINIICIQSFYNFSF